MTIVDWVNQLLVHKKDWNDFSESDQKTFNPFIINRWLSMDREFIEIVNFFQKYSIGLLEPKDTYKWYRDILPKGKRFNRYIKGKKQVKYDVELVDIVCKYYEVSKKECVEYVDILDKNQLKSLLEIYGKEPKQIKKLLKGKK